MRRLVLAVVGFLLLIASVSGGVFGADQILAPQVDGDFWQIAGDPDIGKYTSPKQQPVDFGIWQAADGTWQLWSCIRATAAPGKTRLFYRWQANRLTDRDWTPMGIAMMADPNFGETEGGLQAPFVLKEGSDYYMFYGEWEHIAMAKSQDGKTFARQLTPGGKSGMFGEGPGDNTRDPMVIKIGSLFYIYYTAYPEGHGYDFARTSTDLFHWSKPTEVAYGGSSGSGQYSAECPFVYYHKASGYYYLLRNQILWQERTVFRIPVQKSPGLRQRQRPLPDRKAAVCGAGGCGIRRANLPRGVVADPERNSDGQIKVGAEIIQQEGTLLVQMAGIHFRPTGLEKQREGFNNLKFNLTPFGYQPTIDRKS